MQNFGWIIGLILFGLTVQAQETLVITKLIEYDVPIRQDSDDPNHHWYDATDLNNFSPWLTALWDQAMQGKLTAYHYDTHALLSPEELMTVMQPEPDTFYIIDPVTNEEYMAFEPNILEPEKVIGLRFQEQWSWHAEKGLKKEIIHIAPLYAAYNEYSGDYMGVIPLFWLNNNDSNKQLPAFEATVTCRTKIYTGATDHSWYKNNIDPSGRLKWLDSLYSQVSQEQLTVYREPDNQPITGPMALRESEPDTFRVIDPVTMKERMEIMHAEVGNENIHQIRFNETWSWHPKKGFRKTVQAYTPLYNGPYDSNSIYKPIFRVKNE